MNEISCDICMDLMPLVQDGAASVESEEAVMAHIAVCAACREAYVEEAAPKVDGEKALSTAVKRVKKVTAAVALVFVLMGICLCELIVQGGSLVFLVVVLLIWKLGRVAAQKEQTRIRRGAALLVAVALAASLCATGNTLVGNPFSRMLAEKAAQNYLVGKFPEGGYEVANIWFDSKRGHYGVVVQKIGSQDVRFTLDIDRKGNFRHDTYDDVLTGWNTAHRLEEEYRILVEPVLDCMNLTYSRVYASSNLDFEHRQWKNDPYAFQYFLNGEALMPDGEYDMAALGAAVGHLSVIVEDNTVSPENAADILLEIRNRMDEAGMPFYSIDLRLRHPMPENGMAERKKESIEIEDFLYRDIYARGLMERVRDVSLCDAV